MSEFWFISSTTILPESGTRVATDRPCDYDMGWSTMKEIQGLACEMDMAGHVMVLVEIKRPRLNDSVHDLYVVA